MGSSSFHEFKKQASFFFKEKIKTARLALTDVTPAQLLTEEATNGNPWAPDTRTLKIISKAAFEVDDYWRIVEILHKRLVRFDRKRWRESYKGVILLEHLLTHGPESVAEEFQSDKDVIKEMENFQYIDEKGFNWGLNVRKKSEKVLKLLNERSLLKEERERARKLSRGIQGFGSFCQRSSTSSSSILQESSLVNYRRSNSEYVDHENVEVELSNEEAFIKPTPERSQQLMKIHDENFNLEVPTKKNLEKSYSWGNLRDNQTLENFDTHWSLKENMAPMEDDVHVITGELDDWNSTRESSSLLGGWENDFRPIGISVEEDHPFSDEGHQTKVSLLSSMDQSLEAC